MRNYVLFRSRDTHIWEQFTAMTAWTRLGALRKVGTEEGYTYLVIPVRYWKPIRLETPDG